MEPLNDQICVESIKQIMKIFGGKWAFLIIGSLHSGPKRFNELSRILNINTKALTDTLKNLESNQIIIRKVIPTTPISVEYSLTQKGDDFQQVFLAMRDWGVKWLRD